MRKKFELVVGQCHDIDKGGRDLGPAKRYIVRRIVNTTDFNIGQELDGKRLDDVIRNGNKVTIKE